MSPTWGNVLSSASVIERAQSPTSISISSICSFSSEDLEMEETPSSGLPPRMTVPGADKHEKWYFEEAMVKLLVDNVLYNIPRTLLVRHSEWFRERFAQPAVCLPPGWKSITVHDGYLFVNHDLGLVQETRPGALPAGSMPDVFCLYEVTPFEFDTLLSVLCPDDFDFRFTSEQWSAVLKLATLWRFPSIRDLALKRLDPMLSNTPFERLIAARAYGVDEWAEKALQSLIERNDPLDEAEVARLIPADVVRVYNGYTVRMQMRAVDELRADPLFFAAFKARDDAATAARKAEGQRTSESEPKEAKCKAIVEREDAGNRARQGGVGDAKEEAQCAEQKRGSEPKEAEEHKERSEDAEARRLAEGSQKQANQIEIERSVNEACFVKENANHDAEVEQDCLADSAKLEAEHRAEEPVDVRPTKGKARRQAKERARAKAEEERLAKERDADAERTRIAAAKAEEERIAQEKATEEERVPDATSQAENPRLAEKAERDAEAVRTQAGQQEVIVREAIEAEEASAGKRALDKATPRGQTSQAPAKATSNPSSKPSANHPSSAFNQTAMSFMARVSAQRTALASFPSTRAPALGRSSAASSGKGSHTGNPISSELLPEVDLSTVWKDG